MSFKQRKSPFCFSFFLLYFRWLVVEIYTRDTRKNVRERLMDPVHTKKRFTMRQVAGSSSELELLVAVLELLLFGMVQIPPSPDDDEICGYFFF